MEIRVTSDPISKRHFYGLGVEADGALYNEHNRRSKVSEQELEMIEDRIRALRPSLMRMFFNAGAICPNLEPAALDANSEEYRNNLRMLKVLQGAGAMANVVLFEPFRIETPKLDDAVRCMAAIVKKLHKDEGCNHIRWLTLYNEPESAFPHDSALMRRVFGKECMKRLHTWDDYLHINKLADSLLREYGLYPEVRLAVPDCVWGAQVRKERMTLAAKEFAGMDVAYAYHNYNAEDRKFYEGGNPDFHYDGMRPEAQYFRDLLGPDKPLIVWEFNLAGTNFGSHFPGVDEHGCNVLETPNAGARICDKVMHALAAGVDGFCLWTVSDMHYYSDAYQLGVMRFGLWRYKYEGWLIRPYAYYYAALCHALRPGSRFLKIDGIEPPVNAVACKATEGKTAALLNNGPLTADIAIQWEGGFSPTRLLRLTPGRIDAGAPFPVKWETAEGKAAPEWTLQPYELLVASE